MDTGRRMPHSAVMWSLARKDSTWASFQANAWKWLLLTGLIYVGYAMWGAWRGDDIHDAALARFIAACEGERSPADCAALVARNDEACTFASGLLTDRPEGEADYHECVAVGEAAYREARAARVARRRARREAFNP